MLRVGRLTFGDVIIFGDTKYVITDKDFMAPVVECRLKDGSLVRSFATSDFFHADIVEQIRRNKIKTGDPINGYYPDQSVSALRSSVMGKFIAKRPSLCNQYLSALIKAGSLPAILSNHHITFDFTVSVRTALELGAAVWRFPNLMEVVGVKQQEDGTYEQRTADLPVCSVVLENPAVVSLFSGALAHIGDVINKVKGSLPKNLLDGLLPVSTVVRATVTKDIVGWRNFLLSHTEWGEALHLRVQLFKWMNDAAPPLFMGCEAVIKTFEAFKTLST